MRIGLISDTHDRLESIKKAVDLFNAERVKLVLHAGDLVSPFTAASFKPLKARLHIVWGNNEGDRELIRERFSEIGAQLLGEFAVVELAGRKIALLHGTDQRLVDAVVRSGLFNVVVRGHTHRAEISEGEVLLINPGEACGYLTGRQTVALLDPKRLSAEIVEI